MLVFIVVIFDALVSVAVSLFPFSLFQLSHGKSWGRRRRSLFTFSCLRTKRHHRVHYLRGFLCTVSDSQLYRFSLVLSVMTGKLWRKEKETRVFWPMIISDGVFPLKKLETAGKWDTNYTFSSSSLNYTKTFDTHYVCVQGNMAKNKQ